VVIVIYLFPRLPLDTGTRTLHLSGIQWMFFHLFVLLSGKKYVFLRTNNMGKFYFTTRNLCLILEKKLLATMTTTVVTVPKSFFLKNQIKHFLKVRYVTRIARQ
jgi:hypothetical protein